MSSDSESSAAEEIPQRLGPCEVCGANEAKYTCPKCEVKTCCIKCVNIHKKELECDGIRDRTKFIRMQNFSNVDLLSDYRLLEECARFVDSRKRDVNKKYTRIDKDLPVHLYKLKMAAKIRGTALLYLTQNFTRHAANTTRYDWKDDVISWKIEWVFPNVQSEPLKFVDERCPEGEKLSHLLDKYLNPNNVELENRSCLSYYHAAGFRGVKVLLKAERVKGSANKYFELDTSDTLRESLAGRCIIEHPIICVVHKDHCYNFEIAHSDDEAEPPVDTITTEKNNNIESEKKDLANVNGINSSHDTAAINNVSKEDISAREKMAPTSNGGTLLQFVKTDHINGRGRRPYTRVPRQLITEKFANEKRIELEKELKAEKKKKPKNLLFTTGYSSEESLSGCDSDSDSLKAVGSIKRMFNPIQSK